MNQPTPELMRALATPPPELVEMTDEQLSAFKLEEEELKRLKKIIETMKFNRACSDARALLMSGERATPPRWRAVKKAAERLLRGEKITGSWRDWPRAKTKEETV